MIDASTNVRVRGDSPLSDRGQAVIKAPATTGESAT